MANKNEMWELQQLQALPLAVKVEKTKQRIREFVEIYGEDGVYVSVSGGKDSQVLLHIAKSIYPKIVGVFCNTGLEWDCVRKKGIELADTTLLPKMNFVETIKTYGYPIISKEVSQKIREYRNAKSDKSKDFFYQYFNGGNSYVNYSKYKYLLYAPFRIDNRCCDAMKKRPFKNYEKQNNVKPIIGTMANESLLRRKNWLKYGCNSFEKHRPSSQPLSFWTEQDIFQYILENNLDIADIYGDIVYVDDDGMQYQNSVFDECMELTNTGVERTGCTFCLYGIGHVNKERFLKLKEIEPRKYEFVMNGGEFDESGLWTPNKQGLGYKFVIDWINSAGGMNIKY